MNDGQPMMPTVSIVVPAYNHAQFLPQAIESVLAQDYPGIELIVLNDGSTDHTSEILATYSDRCHCETHANMGQAATLNKGWALSRGELLGYLSADDFLYPGAVSQLVRTLTCVPAALVAYGDFHLVDPRGLRVRRVRAADFDLQAMLTRLACPPGPGAIFRRTAFQETGGWNPDLRQMPDFDFWLRVALRGPFVRVPEPLAAWRAHEASQTFGPTGEERALEPVQIIERIFDDPAMPGALVGLRDRARARAYLVCAQLHARSGRARKGWRAFVHACRLAPRVLGEWGTWRIIVNALMQRPAHHVLWALRAMRRRRSA